jgi:peptide/nickel transport system ATP-binding protein
MNHSEHKAQRLAWGFPNEDTNDDRDLVLKVQGLKVYYETAAGPVKAVDGINLFVEKGERFGLVGESGCGKSTTAMAILRLVQPPGRIVDGCILLDGTDLVQLSQEEMRQIRWSKLSLIPQGAMNSLNPVMRIRDQIGDAITTHEGQQPKRQLWERIEELLTTVGLPRRVAHMYPHELSGGMKQRVCVAMAIALKPQLIIADEPTSALDVVVQRVVTQTVIDVQERLGASLILIGHDMGLQAQIVDRLAIMYAGRVIEVATSRRIFKSPQHPYTQALITAVPSLRLRKAPVSIPGLPPALLNPPSGCIFHPRCRHVMDICRGEVPELREVAPGHLAACHLYK